MLYSCDDPSSHKASVQVELDLLSTYITAEPIPDIPYPGVCQAITQNHTQWIPDQGRKAYSQRHTQKGTFDIKRNSLLTYSIKRDHTRLHLSNGHGIKTQQQPPGTFQNRHERVKTIQYSPAPKLSNYFIQRKYLKYDHNLPGWCLPITYESDCSHTLEVVSD